VVPKSSVPKQVKVTQYAAIRKWWFRNRDRSPHLINIPMPTGIFFHYQQGQMLKDFPQAFEGILEKDAVFL